MAAESNAVVIAASLDDLGCFGALFDRHASVVFRYLVRLYGERRYEATDLEGQRWHFAERFGDIKARGGVVPDDSKEDL